MYLAQIDIFGFKSFATKTKIVFSRGMSAIVGPNGCGKTNVVDALRWVLGEQKSTILRSEVMDNVIFNGSRNRKPLGMAEVTLTIKDNAGVLPADYSEVAITRRLFRSGESEYLINNVKCRLKDITNLFMDTGLGSDTYSVIELKMIEDILSGKPEERRHLLEEAAGVNKFKQRRKEAGNKLNSIQDDLLRINDLVAEVGKLVASLSRQATKTRRYNKLLERHKELEREILLSDFRDAKAEQDKNTTTINNISNNKITATADLASSESTLKSLTEKLNLTDTAFKNAKNTEISISTEISEKDKNIAVENEKLKSYGTELDRLNAEISSFASNSQKTNSDLNDAKTKLSTIQIEKQTNSELIADLKSKRNISSLNAQDARGEYDYVQENLMMLQNNINSMKSTLLKNRSRRENLEDLLDKSTNDIESIKKEIATLETEKSSLNDQQTQLANILSTSESALQTATDRITSLKSQLDTVKSETGNAKNDLNSKKSALDFLRNLLYVDDTSKYLINNPKWKRNISDEIIFLEEAIGVDDKYRIAVESALGQYAGHFIVPDTATARKAINLLQSDNKGKAGFICLDSIPEMPEPEKLSLHDPHIIGCVSEFVRTDKKLRSFLRIILGDTIITDTFASASDAVHSGAVTRAVTLTGEIIDKYGYIRGGGTLKKEGQTVGKQERIAGFLSEIKNLTNKINELTEQNETLLKELNSINLSTLQKEVQSAKTACDKNRQRSIQIGFKSDSLHGSIKAFETSATRYEEELSSIAEETNNLQIQTATCEEQLGIAKENMQVIKNKVTSFDSVLKSDENNLKVAEINRIRIEASESATGNEIRRYTASIENAGNRIKILRQQVANNEVDSANILQSLNVMNSEISELNSKFVAYRNKSDMLNAEKTDLNEQMQSASNDITIKRKNLEKILDNLHATELKEESINAKIENIKSKALEYHGINLDEEYESATTSTLTISNFDEARKELLQLKDGLSKLGNVNFMALEEFEKQSERLRFYESQVKDLTESQNTLQETIREITDTAEKRFMETFDVVNANFQMMFKKLFSPEAESSLALAGENTLDCDIEITARPPGKKPLSIDMLSQGEKTLTAISLLFAIYLVKPSPFCILDEVDAPLDDMNIDRFLNMIKEFSNNTQFMIITHNKKTMMAADTLYGITMQEEGVTKTVSVKLTELD